MYLPCPETRLFDAYFQKVPAVGGSIHLPHPPLSVDMSPRKNTITVFHKLSVHLFENLTTIPNNFNKI